MNQQQDIIVDGNEIVSHRWFTPHEALESFGTGTIKLFPPQFYLLEALSSISFNELNYVKYEGEVLPKQYFEDQKEFLLLPGDHKYNADIEQLKLIHDKNEGYHRIEVKQDNGIFTHLKLIQS